jgi:hypothetical protein
VVEVIFNVEFVKVERDDEGHEGRGRKGGMRVRMKFGLWGWV